MTNSSHLRPDGTTFPPVTPDPPFPPGYEAPEVVDAVLPESSAEEDGPEGEPGTEAPD